MSQIDEQSYAEDSGDKFEISEDLQRDILGLTLSDRSFLINSLSLVKPEYFNDVTHRDLCEIIQKFFAEYNSPITVEVLQNEIRQKHGGKPLYPRYLTEIDIICERIDVALKEREYLSKAVVDFAKAQAMKMAILKSVDLLEKKDYAQIEENIKQALMVSPDNRLGIDIFEDIDERYRRLMTARQSEKYTTGWRTIDRDLSGGLSKKELAMIFAPPGVGKSLYLCNVAANNLMRGKNVLYISVEMAEDLISMRVDSMLSFIPHRDLLTSITKLKERYEAVKSATIGKLKIVDFPAGSVTINDLRAYTAKLYNYTGFRPDVIVLDYLDEVRCSNPKMEAYEGQKLTTTEFRGWMMADDLCGYTATQTNRAGSQVKVARETEVGDSFGKVRVVDAMWSLNQNDDEKFKGVARLFVVKHRNGNSKYMIYVKINQDTFKMTEITEQEYTTIMDGNVPTAVVDENDV